MHTYTYFRYRRECSVVVAGVLLAAFSTGCSAATGPEMTPERLARLDQMQAAKTKNSITIYPVALGGEPSKDVAAVIGLMLEKAGLTEIELADSAYAPDESADFATRCADFAEHVRNGQIVTRYALYAEYLGSPSEGVKEVRGMVVNADGELVWWDRQQPGDLDFIRVRPRNPMTCSVLLVDRLKPAMGLDASTATPDREGKMARYWKVKSGVPSDGERAAIEKRAEAFGAVAPKATIAVCAARVGDDVCKACAERLVEKINDAGLCEAKLAAVHPHLDVAGSTNEQRVLWNLADAAKAHAKSTPPKADYVLYADYMIALPDGPAHAVHFVVCDREGEWVIVDFQNEYQADFKRIRPKTLEDCDQLVVERLRHYLKK